MPTLAEKIKGQRGGGEGRPTNEVFLHPHATYRRCQMKILSAVFQGYVDLDLPVWHLTVISKRWREIAFRTPSLWSKVDVIAVSIHSPTYHSFMDGDRKNFFRGGRHICFDKQSLRILIERSGAAPLDICVECNVRSLPVTHRFLPALRLLIEPSVSRRIAELQLDIQCDNLAEHLPKYFHLASLHGLRRLEIRSLLPEWRQQLIRAISATTRNLEYFTNDVYMQMESISNSVWSSVRYIALKNYIPKEQLERIAQKLSNVHEISAMPRGWPSSATTTTTFRYLKKATLACDPASLCRLQCPALEELCVHDVPSPANDTTPDSVFTEFPALTSFLLFSHRPHIWLSSLLSPDLTTLQIHMDAPYPDRELLKEAELSKFSLLRNFLLGDQCDDETRIAFLENLPQATSVVLLFCERDARFGYTLIPRLTGFRRGFVCCPKLQSLVIGDGHHRLNPRQLGALGPMIGDMMHARERHDSPIKSLKVLCSTACSPYHYPVRKGYGCFSP
ncbi:hypothetical protein CPB86DRAFT_238987 [Serendipita vermifera]|nr:hypothetical protein CPB86DRAFT_238987 [Serendipita vermifera]